MQLILAGLCTIALANAQAPQYTIAFGSLGPSRTTVYLADGDGSGARPLFAGPTVDYNASLSRDGSWIVFTLDRSGSADIFRVHPDGSGLERLTTDAAFDDQGVLSPDGRWLAFVSTRAGSANIWLRENRRRPAAEPYPRIEGRFSSVLVPRWGMDRFFVGPRHTGRHAEAEHCHLAPHAGLRDATRWIATPAREPGARGVGESGLVAGWIANCVFASGIHTISQNSYGRCCISHHCAHGLRRSVRYARAAPDHATSFSRFELRRKRDSPGSSGREAVTAMGDGSESGLCEREGQVAESNGQTGLPARTVNSGIQVGLPIDAGWCSTARWIQQRFRFKKVGPLATPASG